MKRGKVIRQPSARERLPCIAKLNAYAMIFDSESFQSRHIGPDINERDEMLQAIGARSLDALIDETIPARIRLKKPLDLPAGQSEYEYLTGLREIASRNQLFK